MKVATHDGIFHADEVFAISAIGMVHKYDLIRTRNLKELDEATILIDIGGVYDPAKGRFDHHQKGGAGTRDNGVPYASFGVVWRSFGPEVCALALSDAPYMGYEEVVFRVDESLVQGVDARDNGVLPHSEGVRHLTVSDLISNHNPVWFEDQSSREDRFFDAVETAQKILVTEIRRQAGFILAEEMVFSMTTSQRGAKVIILDRYVPWQDVIRTTEPQALFVCFPNLNGGWNIQAVPTGRGFEVRKSFPVSWRGKSPSELSELTACPGATFCHNGGFIMVVKNREEALYVAELAIREE